MPAALLCALSYRNSPRIWAGRLLRCLALLAVVGGPACVSPEKSPLAVRLVDRFQPEMVTGQPEAVEAPAPLGFWDFKGGKSHPETPAGTLGWKAGSGVLGLRHFEGTLQGRSTDDFPVVFLEFEEEIADEDVVHSVQIRMRANKGVNLSVGAGQGKANIEQAIAMASSLSWPMTTPILAGESFQTYSMNPPVSMKASGIGHLLVRPVDEPDAEFEIAEIRLVSRREHLARIASGVGWHGLSEIYRETLVSRAPESILMNLSLPEDSWLDLHVGTLTDQPVTFSVHAKTPSGEARLLRKTVTTARRWERAHVDLSAYSRADLDLVLSLESDEPGAIGFWGSPAIRAREGRSPAATQVPELGKADPPQGVILIQADTLRKDHLDLYGYHRETAPILSGIAGLGAVFLDSVSQATWTKVSTPSIVTSLYPTSHGVTEFTDHLPASALTLAEIYRSAGFATVSYSSVLFTGRFTNLHQGFEELHESTSVSNPDSSKTAREYVDRLGSWLEDHREVPFFAFLHVFDPHDPYEPSKPFNELWADPGIRDAHMGNVEKIKAVIEDPLLKSFGMPTREEIAKAGVVPEEYVANDINWYDGSIRGLDVELGRLLEKLDELGLTEKTLIAFTSDHGEEFLDHGRMFHGQSVYGELAAVPLFIVREGVVPAGLRVGETVQSIDLMPTLLELSHLPVPDGLQGKSLLPLIASGPAVGGNSLALAAAAGWSSRPAITEKAATVHTGGPPPRDTESYAIVFEGWKLIHNTKRAGSVPEFELYRHAADPLDQEDVADRNPEVVERLSGLLRAWKSEAELARLSDESTAQNLSTEELERLRSLGYIQ